MQSGRSAAARMAVARTASCASAAPAQSASARWPPYFSCCSSRSTGNAYTNAATVATNGGGCARHAPHGVAPAPGDAHTGHADGSLGSASAQAGHSKRGSRIGDAERAALRQRRARDAARARQYAAPRGAVKCFCRCQLTTSGCPSTLGHDCSRSDDTKLRDAASRRIPKLSGATAPCHRSKERSSSTRGRPRRAARRRGRTNGGPSTPFLALFALPFPELLFRAQQTHREHHAPNRVQLSTLMSIKTGGCPEDCGYCPQAKRHSTGVAETPLAELARCRRGRVRREGARRVAVLHGRRVARPEGARSRAGARHGARGEGARPRDLLHARHAEGRTGRRR